MISIIDAGFGNIRAVGNMCEHLGLNFEYLTDPKEIKNASKLILPGVGSFSAAADILKINGYAEEIIQFITFKQRPFLGICVGMQVLFNSSEEDSFQSQGLGIFRSDIKKLCSDSQNRLPNMGWRHIEADGLLCSNEFYGNELRYYFTHTYALNLQDALNDSFDHIYQSSFVDRFCCGFEKDNIFGVQFHPEKSHKFGLHLFENFGKI